MTQIELRGIEKAYDGQIAPALRAISLTIQDGETLSVVGPSGCGKSTLLKTIAGLEEPTQGQVLYNGYDVTQAKPQDRGVGMVFQDYALYPTRQGKGNLSYFFEVHQRSPDEEQARIKATAELMGVDFNWLLGQMPDTLSGGQKQRVAIARCIVRDPNIFLMDEPIVNLDAKLRERTRIEMKKLLHQFKVTTVYVTHDQQEAVFMGDRIAVMREGRIEQVGTFDDLYYTPANLFVATFIGTPPIALIPAVVRGDLLVIEGGSWATFGSEQRAIGQARWSLPPELVSALPSGAVRLGVRPEGWLLMADGPGSSGAPMRVSHIERLPTQQASFIHGMVGGVKATVLAPLDQVTADWVRLTPNWEQVYFFSPIGEEALYVPGVPELF